MILAMSAHGWFGWAAYLQALFILGIVIGINIFAILAGVKIAEKLSKGKNNGSL